MGEQGKTIVTAFKQLESFFKEVVQLLTTADSLMKKARWEPASGSSAVADSSGSLNSVHRWLPWYFFRTFEKPGLPHILAFVSVIVGDPEEKVAIDEAIVTAGWIDYGEGNEVGGNWQYWYTRWHTWMSDRSEEGKLCSSDPRKDWENPPEHVQMVSTFGYPLDEITSAADLEQKIVQRLMQEIEEACEASQSG